MSTDLPRLMLVTSRARMKPNFASALAHALEAGARFIQLREPDLDAPQREALAHEAKHLCDQHGATLTINADDWLGYRLGVGAHWPESALASCDWTTDYIGTHWRTRIRPTGASVHSVEIAQWAQAWHFGYLVYGHIFPTSSHEGDAPRGLDALRALCSSVSLPVYAIGGITAHNAYACLAAGAHGVAAIGAAWDGEDVGAAVRALVAAVT